MSSPYLSSPDQQSSIFPDRLIRPLPKRTLRSRLSEEAAESIPFPPNPPSSSFPAFNQYGENGEYMNDAKVLVQQDDGYCDHSHDAEHSHSHHHHCNRHRHDKSSQHINDDDDSLEDEDRKPPPMRTRTNGYRQAPHSPRHTRSSRHNSSKAGYSGADGYDAFENTNNKKKRKIPTSGNTGLHHASLSAELAQLGLNSAGDALDGASHGNNPESQYAAATANGTSSRKDGGRRGSGRNPLGVSTGNSNVPSNQPRASPTDDLNPPDKGIISAAIANATALLRKPLQKGQDGGAVDQPARETSPNTEFTFTCETEAAKGVSFPEQSLYAAGYQQRLANSHAPAPPANTGAGQHPGHAPSTGQANGQYAQQPASQAAAPERKPRRRGKDIYTLAAHDRRVQQAYANRHHPPTLDEIWICQFCEYESIFGGPPTALIRQYEIKDRRERKRLEEKRRLLEKAKMKGRKGKKQSKNAAKAANQQPASQHSYDQQSIDQQPLDEYAGDEYLEVDDGFDDDSVPLPAPPPAPLKPSMPGSYDETRWEGSPGNPPPKGHIAGRAQY